MIRLILDRTVQMSEDEFKRAYRTFDIENEELEKLMTDDYRQFSICGAETLVQQSLSGSDKSSPKSCSTCFGTGKQIHISSHDCLNCDGTGEVEHDF